MAYAEHSVTHWQVRLRRNEDLEGITFKNADEAKAYATAIVTMEK